MPPPKFVLAVSGGGTRDIIPATILDLLRTEMKITIDKFDLVVAVSAGAMVASYACLNPEAKLADLFSESNLKRICDKTLWDDIMGEIQFSPVYNGHGKTLMMNKFFQECKMGDIKTKIAIPVYNIFQKTTELFTSYQPEASQYLVADVCDATSAAVPYFPPKTIGSKKYIDGGFACNDPVLVAYTEARKVFGTGVPIRLLALGTGRQIPSDTWRGYPIDHWGSIQWLQHGLIDLIMAAPLDLEIDNVDRIMHNESIHNRLLYINDDVPDNLKLDSTDKTSLDICSKIGQRLFAKYRPDLGDFFSSDSCRSWSNCRKVYA